MVVELGVLVPARQCALVAAAVRLLFDERQRVGLVAGDAEVGRLLFDFEAVAERVAPATENELVRTAVVRSGSQDATLINVKVTALRLGISVRAVQKRALGLGGTKCDGRWLFDADEIDEIKSRRRSS